MDASWAPTLTVRKNRATGATFCGGGARGLVAPLVFKTSGTDFVPSGGFDSCRLRDAHQTVVHSCHNCLAVHGRRAQSVVAMSSASRSEGVIAFRVLRGRPLRLSAAACRVAASWTERSVPLGKYWRSSPLVFSFE